MASPCNFNSEKTELACPYFMPVSKLENGNWPHPARLPLGGGWIGYCTAPGHEGEMPPQDILHAFCNLGYASGCTWTPQQRTWDAIRFSVSAPADSKKEGSRLISATDTPSRHLRLLYVCERDHRPVEHGELEYDLAQAAWIRQHQDARIQRMAECFLQSYLKKKA
jgi:hypothetical protein